LCAWGSSRYFDVPPAYLDEGIVEEEDAETGDGEEGGISAAMRRNTASTTSIKMDLPPSFEEATSTSPDSAYSTSL
jgi:hypothetical protein